MICSQRAVLRFNGGTIGELFLFWARASQLDGLIGRLCAQLAFSCSLLLCFFSSSLRPVLKKILSFFSARQSLAASWLVSS